MAIRFVDFDMDGRIVAPVIYNTSPHQTTPKGVVLPTAVTEELRGFLAGYNDWVGIEQSPYYRIDAYFDENALWILEINAAFVDGWGTALNLARASNIDVDRVLLAFPKHFACEDPVYMPELTLLIDELAARGSHDHHVVANCTKSAPTYVYGRVGSKDHPNVLPYDGTRLDNKMNLAEYSVIWDGSRVQVPSHYTCHEQAWDMVPQDVVLKFCDKGSEECQKARQSVMFGKPPRKAPFLRQCYEASKLLAQDAVRPTQLEGNNCQLVILAIGNEPITGYVQYSPHKIINDNSIHGPLQMS